MPKLLYPKCPTVTYYYDPTVEFLLGQLFHTLIYNEVGLSPSNMGLVDRKTIDNKTIPHLVKEP